MRTYFEIITKMYSTNTGARRGQDNIKRPMGSEAMPGSIPGGSPKRTGVKARHDEDSDYSDFGDDIS